MNTISTPPPGATHRHEFYGDTIYHKLVIGTYINRLVDHPVEQFQKTFDWFYWENGKWVTVGAGFSGRRLVPL